MQEVNIPPNRSYFSNNLPGSEERSASCLPVPSTRESSVQPLRSTASTIRADTSAGVSLFSNTDVLHPPESAVSIGKVDTSTHPPGSDQVSLPLNADIIQPATFVDPLAIISISTVPSNPSTANIPCRPKIPAEENSPVSEAPQGKKGRTATSGEDATYQQPSVAFRCDWVTCNKDFTTYTDLYHHLIHGSYIKELRNIDHDSLHTHDQQLFKYSFCEKRLTSGPDLLSHKNSPGRLDQEGSIDLNKVMHPKWRATLVSGGSENSTNLSKVISFKRKPTFISGTCSGLTPMGCGLRSSEYFSLSLYCNLSEYSTKVYSDSSVSISASYGDSYQLKLTPPAIHQEFQLTQLTVPHTGNTPAKFDSIRYPEMPVSSFRLTVRIALFNSSLNHWEEISSATSRPVAPYVSNPHKIAKVSPSNSKNNRAQHYLAQYPQQHQQAPYGQVQHHQHYSQHHQSQLRFQHPQEHHSQPQYHHYQQQQQHQQYPQNQSQPHQPQTHQPQTHQPQTHQPQPQHHQYQQQYQAWYSQPHHLQHQQQPPFQHPQKHHSQPKYHPYQQQQQHQEYPQNQSQPHQPPPRQPQYSQPQPLQPRPLQPRPLQPRPHQSQHHQPQLQPQHPDPMQLFETISQNVYTANTKAKKGQDLGLCQCKDEPNPEGHCPELCTNKVSRVDCDKATYALWDKGCRYSLLSTLPSPNSVVKPFWTGCPKYTGKVVSKKELERKAILIRQYLPEISQERAFQEATQYAVNFDRNLFLDAQLKGSLARFINHHPRPNCTIEKYHFKGKLCYVIHTGKEGIKKGEELTLLYSRIHNFEK